MVFSELDHGAVLPTLGANAQIGKIFFGLL